MAIITNTDRQSLVGKSMKSNSRVGFNHLISERYAIAGLER